MSFAQAPVPNANRINNGALLPGTQAKHWNSNSLENLFNLEAELSQPVTFKNQRTVEDLNVYLLIIKWEKYNLELKYTLKYWFKGKLVI